MAYSKLNLKNGQKWTQDHIAHIEAGIIANEAELEKKALKTDIPDISGLVTDEELLEAIGNLDIPSIEGLATKEFVLSKMNNSFNGVGVPHVYTTTFDDTGLAVFENVASIYSAFDILAEEYPHMFKKNGSIGKDASGTYDIKYYTLGQSNPKITTDRAGANTNQWNDTKYLRRRIFINGNIHSWVERHCVYGLYLFIKEILESNEQWALFIKNNLILDIVPQPNPWGYDNKTNVNVNNKNLNRTYLTNLEAENQCIVDLIEALIPRGLIAIIDLHNTNDSTPGYTIGRTTHKYWDYLCILASQIEAITHSAYKELYGTDRDSFYHMWNYDSAGISGLLNDYADTKGLLCYTSEVGTSLAEKGSIMTKMTLVNLINAFANFNDLMVEYSDSIPEIPSVPENEEEEPTVIRREITDLFAFTDGAAIETYAGNGNGGGTYATSLFKYSDYVDVSEMPEFEMSFVTWRSGAGNKATLGYALYDIDKNYLEGRAFDLADASLGNSAGTPYMEKVSITNSNVKYIRTCYPTDATKYGEFQAFVEE